MNKEMMEYFRRSQTTIVCSTLLLLVFCTIILAKLTNEKEWAFGSIFLLLGFMSVGSWSLYKSRKYEKESNSILKTKVDGKYE